MSVVMPFMRSGRCSAVLAVVALVAAAALAGCGGPERSAASFCRELRTSTDKMKSNVQGASGQLSSQLDAALANLGEFTRMLHRLDDRAPDEVKSDMDAAVKVWDAQQQALGQAAKDPLGAIATSLSASLFNAASLRAVDHYAVANCRQSVFGLEMVGGSTGGGTGSGTGAAWSCTTDLALLDNGTPYSRLTSALAGMRAAGGAISGPAGALAEAVGRLSPAPRTAAEALGRLRFSGTDVDSLLSTLNSAVASACGGTGLLSDEQMTAFKNQFGPAPIDGGFRLGNGYGQCADDELGWAGPLVEVLRCSDAVATVDLSTGVLTRLDGIPSDQDSTVQVAGNRLVWVTVEVQPAQGLNQAGWAATMHLRDLTGGTVADVQAAQGSGDPPPAADLIEGAWPGRVLLGVQGSLRMFDGNGRLLWTRQAAGPGAEQTTSSTLWLGGRTLVNINTGQVIKAFGDAVNGQSETNDCGTDAMVYDDWGGTGLWVAEPAGGQPTGRNVGRDLFANLHDFAVTSDGIVDDNGEGLQATNLDGARTWSIAADVVKSAVFLGRWIVVTNPSGAEVLVDAATGKDVTAAQPEVAKVLFPVADHPGVGTGDGRRPYGNGVVYADPASDVVVVKGFSTAGDGAAVVYKTSWHAICG